MEAHLKAAKELESQINKEEVQASNKEKEINQILSNGSVRTHEAALAIWDATQKAKKTLLRAQEQAKALDTQALLPKPLSFKERVLARLQKEKSNKVITIS
jgi:hypothetical protein